MERNTLNPQVALRSFFLWVKLEDIVDANTIIGYSILQSIKSTDNTIRDTLRMIVSQGEDNPKLMAEVIGQQLYNEIVQHISEMPKL